MSIPDGIREGGPVRDPWEDLPRMFNEPCDGCPRVALEVYALDHPRAGRVWLCELCWVRWSYRMRREQGDVRKVA